MKNIGIIGCGWLGLHLSGHLKTSGRIFTTVTSERKKTTLLEKGFETMVVDFPDVPSDIEPWTHLSEMDAIVITVPFGKKTPVDALLHRFSNICRFLEGYGKQLFLMSSIGIYPSEEIEIDEQTFLDDLLDPGMSQVEALVRSHFPQVNVLRLGGLMGGTRVFSNYSVPLSGIVNHVHYEDVCLVIAEMMRQNSVGKCYNVVAPMHPEKSAVYFFQKGIKSEEKAIENRSGRKVLSDLLMEELGYEFRHPDPRTFF